jgi:hypothetical protein
LAFHTRTSIPVQFALQYELIDFTESRREYPSPREYQTIRPLVELKPQITSSLQLLGRLELAYVVDESEWGTGINLGAEVKVKDRVGLRAMYLRQRIPGSFNVYDGNGFNAGLSWRW